TDAALQPARVVRRLAARAAVAGAEIREGERVESVEQVDADQVVVATDGYPSGLLGALEGLIVPTRGQMIATEPIPERLFDCPHYGRHGFDYWQQREDGRLLVGGFRDVSLEAEFTTAEETTPEIQHALEALAADLVGRPVEVTHRWAGIFGLVLDFLPVAGRVPGEDSLWVAGGYSGHGNVLGLLCGELVAAAVLGREAPQLGRPLVGGERDGEVLHGEPGRVEGGDLVRPLAPGRGPGEDGAELGHELSAQQPGPERVRQVAGVPGLLEVVAEDAHAGELLGRDLLLVRPVRAHQADVLACPQRALRVQDLPAGRDRRDHVRGERLLERGAHVDAQLLRRRLRAAAVEVVERRPPPPGEEGTGDRAAVDAGADDAHGGRVGPGQRVRGQHRRGAGAQGGERGGVEQGEELAGGRVRQERDAEHGRQPARRVAGEGADPLEQRVAAAA